MKKREATDRPTRAAGRFQVDLVTRLRFSQIWHNNLFAYSDRPSNFDTLEAAEEEAEYRNRTDGIDLHRRPETLWRVRR